GTRELLRDAQLQARLCEGGRVERRAVVCDDALDCHTQLGVVRDCCVEEADGTRPALIGMDPREGNARVVVDGNEDVLPSDVPGSLAIVASDSMTCPAGLRRHR